MKKLFVVLAIGALDWDSEIKKKEGTRWLHHVGIWPRVPSDRGRRSRPSLLSSNGQLTLSRYVTEGTILNVLIARGALCHPYPATGTFRNTRVAGTTTEMCLRPDCRCSPKNANPRPNGSLPWPRYWARPDFNGQDRHMNRVPTLIRSDCGPSSRLWPLSDRPTQTL